jgi:recombination protein RecA
MMSKAKGLLQARDLIDKGLAKLGSGQWKHEQVPTGVKALDDLFGGWPKGRFSEVFGNYGTGKSTIAYHTLAACKDLLPLVDAGFVDEKKKPRQVRAILIDTEGSYDAERLTKFGFPPEELGVLSPDYGEQGLDAVEAFAACGVEMIVVDSLRGLVPGKTVERDRGKDEQQPGIQAKMFSDFFSRYALWHQRPTLIGVNQMYMKIGVPLFANPYETPGGMNMKYIAAFRLQVRQRMKLKRGDKVIGHEMAARVEKSKVGPSYIETVVPLVYRRGFVSWSEWEKIKSKKGVSVEE